MSDHLDECSEVFIDCYGSSCDCEYSHFCICDALRSCEVRVRGQEQQRIEAALTFVGQHDAAWELAVRDKALRDAREAVELIPAPYKVVGNFETYGAYHEGRSDMKDMALSAIDALREERQ
jgi:hypothetical protein